MGSSLSEMNINSPQTRPLYSGILLSKEEGSHRDRDLVCMHKSHPSHSIYVRESYKAKSNFLGVPNKSLFSNIK